MLTSRLSQSNSAGAAAPLPTVAEYRRIMKASLKAPFLLPGDAANTCKRQLETMSSDACRRSVLLAVCFLIKLGTSGKTSPDRFVLVDKTEQGQTWRAPSYDNTLPVHVSKYVTFDI